MKSKRNIVSLIIFLITLFCPLGLLSGPDKVIEGEAILGKPLKTSWETAYPYKYLKNPAYPSSLTGLDVQLIKALAKEAEQKVQFQPYAWQQAVRAIEAGTLDFISGATYSAERAQYAFFSKAYRFEENAVFVLRDKMKTYSFDNTKTFLAYIKKNPFRLGVKAGALFADDEINGFVRDPNNAALVITVLNEEEALKQLLQGKIDGFLADRIVGSALIWQAKEGDKVAEIPLNMKVPVYLMFSKKTVSAETVDRFNKAIDNLKQASTYDNITSWYIYPVILLHSINANWFKVIDILGIIFFSISGVLIAYSVNASLIATFLYAFLPSLGGGLLRDIIFNKRPVDALVSPLSISIVIFIVLLGSLLIKVYDKIAERRIKKQLSYYHQKFHSHFKLILTTCDGLGLAAFTVSGVIISLVAKVEPLWLWGPFFAFLTGAFGPIVRDILSKREKLAEIEGEIYSEIAIVWGLFLSVALTLTSHDVHPELIQNLVFMTVAGVFLTRMLIYFLRVPNVYFR